MKLPGGVEHYLSKKQLAPERVENLIERRSDRMEYWKVRAHGGAEYFLKQAKTEDLQKQIKAQFEGARLLEHTFDDNSPLQVEKVVGIGPDWLLTEWIDGKPYMQPEDINGFEADEKLAHFAEWLAYIDSKSNTGLRPSDGLCFGSNTPSVQFVEKTAKKTEFMFEKDISSEFVTGVIRTIDEAAPHMTPSLQHGDFTPWHVLESPPGKKILIDCEHVHSNWPRHYDLANFYSQLSVRFDRDDLADQLASRVSSQIGEDVYESLDFRTTVLMRNFMRAVEYKDDEPLFQRAIQKTEAWQARYT